MWVVRLLVRMSPKGGCKPVVFMAHTTRSMGEENRPWFVGACGRAGLEFSPVGGWAGTEGVGKKEIFVIIKRLRKIH